MLTPYVLFSYTKNCLKFNADDDGLLLFRAEKAFQKKYLLFSYLAKIQEYQYY
jgi:hypothetical protein